MKPTIIAIVGPSGSGKTFAAEYLKQAIGIPVIVSFTTRPMRLGETNGIEHIFVDETKMPPKDQMLAYTQFGDHHYWADINQVPINGKCIYVIDEKGVIYLMDHFRDRFEIIPVLIKRDIEKLNVPLDRIKRDYSRIKLKDDFYQYIISNNGTLDEFKQNLLSTFKQI